MYCFFAYTLKGQQEPYFVADITLSSVIIALLWVSSDHLVCKVHRGLSFLPNFCRGKIIDKNSFNGLVGVFRQTYICLKLPFLVCDSHKNLGNALSLDTHIKTRTCVSIILMVFPPCQLPYSQDRRSQNNNKWVPPCER